MQSTSRSAPPSASSRVISGMRPSEQMKSPTSAAPDPADPAASRAIGAPASPGAYHWRSKCQRKRLGCRAATCPSRPNSTAVFTSRPSSGAPAPPRCTRPTAIAQPWRAARSPDGALDLLVDEHAGGFVGLARVQVVGGVARLGQHDQVRRSAGRPGGGLVDAAQQLLPGRPVVGQLEGGELQQGEAQRAAAVGHRALPHAADQTGRSVRAGAQPSTTGLRSTPTPPTSTETRSPAAS